MLIFILFSDKICAGSLQGEETASGGGGESVVMLIFILFWTKFGQEVSKGRKLLQGVRPCGRKPVPRLLKNIVTTIVIITN